MRLFFWFVISNVLLLLILVNPGLAQDSLTFNTTPLTLTPSSVIDATSALRWRLSGTLGYHGQIQQESLDKSLYLTSGFQATVAADYFVGRNWGLGLLIGYQNLSVSDAYKNDPAVPKLQGNSSAFFPITALHSFMLAAGPALSASISPRLTLDLDVRGGGFFNDAPIIRAYYVGINAPSLIITPSDQRFRLGFIGSIGLKYQVTQQFSAGISGNASYSSFNYTQIYTTGFNLKRVDLNMYGIQATVSYHLLPSARQRPTASGATTTAAVVTPVTPRPICYPPVLDPNQQSGYEVGSNQRPVIRWRSSAPIYTEGEQYVFRLYTLPGNKLLFERTVRETQISWPAQVTLPDTTSYYFYSLYTRRSDELEQTCQSEPIVGTLGFTDRQSPVPAQTTAPRKPVYVYTLRLYELQPTLVSYKAPPQTTAKTAKRSPKTNRSAGNRQTEPSKSTVPPADSIRADSTRSGITQSDSVRTRLAATDSVSSRSTATDSVRARVGTANATQLDSMITTMQLIPKLLHEEPIPQPSFNWPSQLPPPAQPTVYQYTITRNSTREFVQDQYVMVEPDGCFLIITEAVKNMRFQNTVLPTAKPALESTPPTNK